MKRLPFVFIFLLLIKVVGAQSILETKINGLYFSTLDVALDRISQQHNVVFQFDRTRAKGIRIEERPFNQPLSKFIGEICKENKLKYYVNAEGAICLIERWENPNLNKFEVQKTYTGKPEKYNFTLTGKVIDITTRETLPFVNLSVKGTSIGAATNVDGYFTLVNVPSDTVTIECTYIGYEKQTLFLNPTIPTKDLMVEMIISSQELKEVVVIGEKQDIMKTNEKTSMIKLTPIKLGTLPSMGEKDIFRAFQLMPGISAANENSSGLYVRGGTPDQTLVLYDGFTVYNVEHLFGFFSAFNPNAIKDVQLYKGGFDAKFGGRISSVVEITGKDGDRKDFNACADIGTLAVNSFFETPIGQKTSAIFSFRRSWKSPIYNKIFEQFNTEPDNPMPGRFGQNENNSITSYFYDINAKVTYRPSEDELVSLSFYNGADDLDNSIEPSMGGGGMRISGFSMKSTDLTYWGNTGASIRWSKNWSNKFFTNGLGSYSNYFSKRDRSTGGSFIDPDGVSKSINRGIFENNNLLDYSTKIDCEYKRTHNHIIEFGAQTLYNSIDYTYSQNDTIAIIDRHTNGATLTGYLQDKMNFFNEKLLITNGLRYNYFANTSGNYFEPRAGASYQLTPKIKLKSSFGIYYQFAKRVIREDILQGSRDFWALADGNRLPVSSSTHYIFGFSYDTNNFLVDIEGYYKKLENLSEYSLRFDPKPGSVSYEESFLVGSGFARGIDFLLQKKHGNFTGWIGYTLGEVINKFDAYGNYYFYASNDVTHEFKVVNSYKWLNWDFSATWVFATGKPYTAPEGGYQLTLLDGTVRDYINVSVKNGLRLPDYHRLDIAASYKFILGPNSPAVVSFSVFNLYNRTNSWYNEYEIIDYQVIETPVKFLGITPNINLTIKFR
jgi:hypothetical protein